MRLYLAAAGSQAHTNIVWTSYDEKSTDDRVVNTGCSQISLLHIETMAVSNNKFHYSTE